MITAPQIKAPPKKQKNKTRAYLPQIFFFPHFFFSLPSSLHTTNTQTTNTPTPNKLTNAKNIPEKIETISKKISSFFDASFFFLTSSFSLYLSIIYTSTIKTKLHKPTE